MMGGMGAGPSGMGMGDYPPGGAGSVMSGQPSMMQGGPMGVCSPVRLPEQNQPGSMPLTYRGLYCTTRCESFLHMQSGSMMQGAPPNGMGMPGMSGPGSAMGGSQMGGNGGQYPAS